MYIYNYIKLYILKYFLKFSINTKIFRYIKQTKIGLRRKLISFLNQKKKKEMNNISQCPLTSASCNKSCVI